MKVTITNRQILKIAGPIAIALLIPQVSFFVNTAFMGHMGSRELAIIGISSIYYLVLSGVGMGLNNGMQVLLSRKAGAMDYEGMGKLFSNGWAINIFTAALLIGLSYLLAPIILSAGLHDPEIRSAAAEYLSIRSWGLLFLFQVQLTNSLYISTQHTKYMIAGSLAAMICNVFFDYTMIFGNMGFPAFGVNGAAYASLIGEGASVCILYGILFIKKFPERYGCKPTLRLNIALTQQTFKVSLPLVIQYCFSLGSWLIFYIFIEHLGEESLAISQVMRSIFGMFGIFMWAFGYTTNTMVSNLIGQGMPNRVTLLVKKMWKLSFGCAAFLCVWVLLFPYAFLGLFTNQTHLIADAIPSLYIVTLATLIMSLAAVAFNAVTGTGVTTINVVIEGICITAYLCYNYFIVHKMRMPLAYAWASEWVYWSILLIASTIYLFSGRWKSRSKQLL